MTGPPQLRLSGLRVEFGTRAGRSQGPVISDLDLSAGRNRFIAIVGPSGCGKTTLLRVLIGLERAAAGRIEWQGDPVSNIAPHAAMVFQTANLLPWRTVGRNISYGLELQGASTDHIRRRVDQLLALTGLQAHVHKRPFELSGGMQQRVNLARALAVKPSVLLMDEPFSALDTILRERLQAELQAIWMREPCLVLFVTHQLDEALWLADDVLVMGDSPGRIIGHVPVELPRPRRRDRASIARLAALQSELRDRMELLGSYAFA